MAARFEETLQLLQANSSEFEEEVFFGDAISGRDSERLSNALQSNTHVKSLIIERLIVGGNYETLFRFIAQSESLENLSIITTNLPPLICQRTFDAISGRSHGLNKLKLKWIGMTDMVHLQGLLQNCPLIQCLHIWFPQSVVNMVDQGLALAASAAKIQSLVMYRGLACPLASVLIEGFKNNHCHLKQVSIDCNEYVDAPQHLLHARSLLRLCCSARFSLALCFASRYLQRLESENEEAMLALVNELKERSHFTKVYLFGPFPMTEFVTRKLLPALQIGDLNRELCLKDVAVDKPCAKRVTSITRNLRCGRVQRELFQSLIKPTSVVESLRGFELSADQPNDVELLLELIPRCSMRKLLFRLSAGSGGPAADATVKDKIIKALWKNRSLQIIQIYECDFLQENDRAILARICRRNKFLPGQLRTMASVSPSLWPHLLALSGETDQNEFFQAFRDLPSMRTSRKRHRIA